jgi:hypothetical protein
MPASFEAYLKHATQEQFQKLLWNERAIPTEFLKGSPWPPSFYGDVGNALEHSRGRSIKWRPDFEEHVVGASLGAF